MAGIHLETDRRRETLRTNLWFVPTLEVVGAVGLFAVTYGLDRAAYHGAFAIPSWVIGGTPDAARQVLTAIAAAIITVVGVVFSITIVALTLASTQFGPRMLRNFIRDRGTQLTLGTFVATFVYAIAALVVIGPDFVPHISTTVSIASMVVDLAVLIYFINHIAGQIQLPNVIADIAREVNTAVEANRDTTPEATPQGPGVTELLELLAESGGEVRTTSPGYLRYIRYDRLVRLAAQENAVIELPYRPGHFLTEGQVVATVWPAEAAERVAENFARGHVTGATRTLVQDVSFGIDQIVEIALRALSSAINDTFTALTCIDWLGDCLSRIAVSWNPTPVRRCRDGYIRVIAAQVSYERLVQRAFEKIRQAGVGQPAVMIRELDALAQIADRATDPERRRVVYEQAAMIERQVAESVLEQADREDVLRRCLIFRTALALT
ncbi:DUF2254 domain-containing protein [Nocardia terpenica]|uniref:DUF2254 domain-containing protein n=1 Tax=Nocardia terpenica TaxID=455432 RepID=A0A164NL62_9NOCA|nr:DUF2254 domain-containing protein [Nocardia terpenica]KZM74482.1 hypothetical protein AWN90_25810 [Nocardia terpenica]NQE92902.1 DUF2254 domain-containing protein [Nocardia terpenica]